MNCTFQCDYFYNDDDDDADYYFTIIIIIVIIIIIITTTTTTTTTIIIIIIIIIIIKLFEIQWSKYLPAILPMGMVVYSVPSILIHLCGLAVSGIFLQAHSLRFLGMLSSSLTTALKQSHEARQSNLGQEVETVFDIAGVV